jgi:hypothetical protein
MSSRDPRITALRRFAISISLFTVAGHALLGFEQAYLTPLVGVLTAYAVDLLLETAQARLDGHRPRYAGSLVTMVDFLLPAHITGLACAMLLYGNERLWPTIFAVTFAIASKYAVRVSINGRARHVLNPSNVGISATVVLFSGSVAIAPPYQFTEHVTGTADWLIPLGVLTAGTLLNAGLTRRMPLIAGWAGGFVIQAVVRTVLLDHSLVAALVPMTGVAFILFTNYMITDPGTTPTAPRRQVGFGLATAGVYGLLVSMHVAFGLFFALTLVCLGRFGVLLAVRAWRVWGRGPAQASGRLAHDHEPELAAARAGQSWRMGAQ